MDFYQIQVPTEERLGNIGLKINGSLCVLSGILAALIMAMIAVLVHFEALLLATRAIRHTHHQRRTLLQTWCILLSAHVVQIWLYAVAYYLGTRLGVGGLMMVDTPVLDFSDYVYFSAVVYTTLGFGDIVPTAGFRFLAGSEALVGLCLIAWSATATYANIRRLD